jgi:hypothetical protein
MSEMKNIIFLILILTSLKSLSENFLRGIDDIPTYKNMVYVEESLVMFDKINGRFVSTEIVGKYNYSEVSEFYKNILPNLGWKLITKNLYQRGDESLKLEYKLDGKQLRVLFNIYPNKSE